MKIKVVVVDFEVPARVKRLVLGVGIPLAILAGAGAIAYADVPHVFKNGDVLQGAELNSNFDELDKRLAAVEKSAVFSSLPTCTAADEGKLVAHRMGGGEQTRLCMCMWNGYMTWQNVQTGTIGSDTSCPAM